MFIFKRNQIIITALVFMVSIAAYLNFTDRKNAVQPTFDDDGQKISDTAAGVEDVDEIYDDFFTSYELADIDTLAPDFEAGMDDELTAEVDGDEITGEDALEDSNLVSESKPISLKDKMMVENKKVTDGVVESEEVVLVNKSHDVNYFVEAKMDREQKRSEQIEMLAECLGTETLDKDSKANAASNLITLQERIENESAIESLLKAKGFKEVFVRISDDDVDVVINRDKIEEADIAQIEDIVRRKTGYATSQIRISPLKS